MTLYITPFHVRQLLCSGSQPRSYPQPRLHWSRAPSSLPIPGHFQTHRESSTNDCDRSRSHHEQCFSWNSSHSLSFHRIFHSYSWTGLPIHGGAEEIEQSSFQKHCEGSLFSAFECKLWRDDGTHGRLNALTSFDMSDLGYSWVGRLSDCREDRWSCAYRSSLNQGLIFIINSMVLVI